MIMYCNRPESTQNPQLVLNFDMVGFVVDFGQLLNMLFLFVAGDKNQNFIFLLVSFYLSTQIIECSF
jgi:hypothetical protein